MKSVSTDMVPGSVSPWLSLVCAIIRPLREPAVSSVPLTAARVPLMSAKRALVPETTKRKFAWGCPTLTYALTWSDGFRGGTSLIYQPGSMPLRVIFEVARIPLGPRTSPST